MSPQETNMDTSNVENRRRYRGGFRTSICDLFKDPSRRNDCCALACLGVFSSDRTEHLLSKHYSNVDEAEAVPWLHRWLIRFVLFVILPAILILFNKSLATNIEDKKTSAMVANFIFWSYVVFLILCRFRFVSQQRENRLRLLKLVQERNFREELSEGEQIDDDLVQRLVLGHRADVYSAHRSFFSAYEKDEILFNTLHATSAPIDHDRSKGDFCTSIWNFFKSFCCGACCNIWLQCCSMCAIGQEEREINLLLPKSAQMIDYVSFQHYNDYYPAIQNLRSNSNGSLLAHFHALSDLSKVLLKSLLAFVVFSLVFSITTVDKNFTFYNFIVLLGVFGQAFLILYLIHWQWCRFDISLDAVVKYFASGFFISMSFAMVYELLLQILEFIIAFFTVEIELLSDSSIMQRLTNPNITDEQRTKVLIEFLKNHRGTVLFFVFLNAFIVAAFVEELSKYFGFWMVDHPDFTPDEELEESPQNGNTFDDQLAIKSDFPIQKSHHKRTLNQLGTATTVGLVSAATGFACFENIMYVFSYSGGGGLQSEIITLIIRSCLPVHPICAAIQSIGICKRDLEKEPSMKLGKAIFPAILLHGIYDFVLMAITAMAVIDNLGENNDKKNDDPITWGDLIDELPALAISAGIVFIFVLYYVIASKKQKTRLYNMETLGHNNQGANAVLLV